MRGDWFMWACSVALITLVLGLGFSKKIYTLRPIPCRQL